MMAEHEVWWSMQPFLDDEDAIAIPDPSRRAEQLRVLNGTDTAYQLAKKHQVKLAWGTDTIFEAKLASRRGAQLAEMTRWFTPAEVLQMATSANAELLAMSGQRNPYSGRLGVVEEGALADLLLVDGNPLQDLSLVATPDTSFSVIMKDGRIYKNGLASQADRVQPAGRSQRMTTTSQGCGPLTGRRSAALIHRWRPHRVRDPPIHAVLSPSSRARRRLAAAIFRAGGRPGPC